MKALAHLLNGLCVEIASSAAVTTERQFKPNVHLTILGLFQAAAHRFMSDKQTVGIECNPKHTLVDKKISHLIGRGPRRFTQSLLGAAPYAATVLYCCDFSETVQQHPDRRSTALLSSVSRSGYLSRRLPSHEPPPPLQAAVFHIRRPVKELKLLTRLFLGDHKCLSR